MKKVLTGLLICIISLAITLFSFEALSWYHFGDVPTSVVLWRFIIVFVVIATLLGGITFFIYKILSTRKK